ncbi:MAG TPA: bifunctional aldolase/short-chain dehydrogenase [Myxococcota bacterium]|nr:bifunctional aldolase/short-chain dehydrogenase [Myxococcota bacterium]
MKSLWSDADARRAVLEWGAEHGELLALRIYSSRLIGAESELVLHGGGNTSLKAPYRTLLGETLECLYVKGSGSSLDRVGPRDFPALDLAYLRRLEALPSLADEEMVNQLRTHLFDAAAPNPSIEALLHAFLPHRFVDHSHADAVLAITNQPDGEKLVCEALGDRVVVLPYIMPGFPLAKAVAKAAREEPSRTAIVLIKHGLFTFGADARESYERHIECVDACQRFAEARARGRSAISVGPSPAGPPAAELVARAAPVLRGLLAERGPDPEAPPRRTILDWRASPEVLAFCASGVAAPLADRGPLTPDHVIRTKALPLFVEDPAWDDASCLGKQLERAVANYRAAYDAYFEEQVRTKGVSRTKLDSAPRVVLLPGAGALCFGRTKQDAAIAADITEHTLRTKALAEAIGRYEALSLSDLFDMEYWSLEQAKLGRATERPLERQVVLITGGAGAIGIGVAEVCAGAGAHVVLADLDEPRVKAAAETVTRTHGTGRAAGVAMDVTDETSVQRAFNAACMIYGGVDVVVANAGVAVVAPIATLSVSEVQRVAEVNYLGVLLTVREAARIFRMQGTGGNIIVNASKNVFAPGKDFGAYSASKAAAHQIGKVAAIELAPLGVRVNLINADAVFAEGETPSGLWQTVGPARARSRGLPVEALPDFYRDRSLLHTRVSARHVGNAVVFFASNQTPTTGATLPVDGGIVEAFPR